MDENTMKDIQKAIEISTALAEVTRIAQNEIVTSGDNLHDEMGYVSRKNYAERVATAYKVLEIVESITDRYPITGGDIYSRIYNIVK